MTILRSIRGKRPLPALLLAVSIFAFGCGDSSGPGSVDATAALQSLALGFQGGFAEHLLVTDSASDIGTRTTPGIEQAFAGMAPLLKQVNVTIDGSSQQMFAVGWQESFPDGTCEENIFVDPAFPPDPGACTPPILGTVLIFWQSHSANAPPDRMLLVVAGPGTVNFNYESASPLITAVALYVEGQNNLWSSLSGSLTTGVSSLNMPCTLSPLPPYAKSASCSFAAFDEQGQIVFEPLTIDGSSNRRMTIAIPRQTINGIWLSITAVQPVSLPLTGNRVLRGIFAPRFGQLTPRSAVAR